MLLASAGMRSATTLPITRLLPVLVVVAAPLLLRVEHLAFCEGVQQRQRKKADGPSLCDGLAHRQETGTLLKYRSARNRGVSTRQTPKQRTGGEVLQKVGRDSRTTTGRAVKLTRERASHTDPADAASLPEPCELPSPCTVPPHLSQVNACAKYRGLKTPMGLHCRLQPDLFTGGRLSADPCSGSLRGES